MGCRKNPQIPNFMKIRPVGLELFHADGQTERIKLTVSHLSSNFAEVPTNSVSTCYSRSKFGGFLYECL